MSNEKEELKLKTVIKIKKDRTAEVWMKELEVNMMESVARKLRRCKEKLFNDGMPRKDWVMKNKGQSIATISMVSWTIECEMSI